MKKRKYVNIIFIILILLLVTACKNEENLKSEKLTYSATDYEISVNVPKGKNYKIIKGIVENAKNSYKNAEYTIISDKLRIEIDEAEITFTESDFYSKKYGPNRKKSWDNYKQYILDDEITHLKEQEIELIKVAGIENIQYKIYWDSIDGYDGIFRVINSDDIGKDYLINIYIFPVDESKNIKELLNDKEVKIVLDSLKITKK